MRRDRRDAGRSLVLQYLQERRRRTALRCIWLSIINYKKEYDIAGILRGEANQETYRKLGNAPFDERISVVHHLTEKLEEILKEAVEEDELTCALYEALKKMKAPILEESK